MCEAVYFAIYIKFIAEEYRFYVVSFFEISKGLMLTSFFSNLKKGFMDFMWELFKDVVRIVIALLNFFSLSFREGIERKDIYCIAK